MTDAIIFALVIVVKADLHGHVIVEVQGNANSRIELNQHGFL